jgi:hypothetical protein
MQCLQQSLTAADCTDLDWFSSHLLTHRLSTASVSEIKYGYIRRGTVHHRYHGFKARFIVVEAPFSSNKYQL